MQFKPFAKEDYNAVCDFLIELNRDNNYHINWNWARFEWMYEHPEFDKSAINAIGLWIDDGRVVGAAIYDMYFGEGFCAALPGYEELYPAILDYAYNTLKDDAGFGIAICDDNAAEIAAAENAGFIRADQTETMMRMALNEDLLAPLPDGYRFVTLDPAKDAYAFQWMLWQGFDHGVDRDEFEREDPIVPQIRQHFDPRLSIAVQTPSGENTAYCCLWYSNKTDYAYVEPVCVIPGERGKGLAKAIVFEALSRARGLGAKKAFVLSDMAFYEKLGFEKDLHFTFYWKK